ncbi:MAG TPA: Rrf2 family transcriptional regulator [Candidatus Ozemobacteraceae bacterium]|nr:Rrf2 family transcriptional regulator [Candidatus Ozemobacteraceae bacterium]
MAEIVKFSDAVVLGFHAMIDLAEHPGHEVPLHDIAVRLRVSEAHLSKVLQRLRKVGLVQASRGPSGGYRLAHPPAGITFACIFEAIDGPIQPQFCLFGTPVCTNPSCWMGSFIGQINQQVKNFLEQTTLADLPIRGFHPLGQHAA